MNYKKCILIFSTLIFTYFFVGCSAKTESTENKDTATSNESINWNEMFTERDLDSSYTESECTIITLEDNELVSITKEGAYLLRGSMTDGQIQIDVSDTEKVHLIFDGVSITNSSSASLYIKEADKVFCTLAPNSCNFLSTTGKFIAMDDNNIDGTVFSKADLTFNGTGELTIENNYGHGIISKDDLVFASGTYNIIADSHTISGKDSVRIANGSFTLNAGTDALHSDGVLYIAAGEINAPSCYEGGEAQTIYIKGGTISLTASDDGLNASSDSSNTTATTNDIEDPFAIDNSCSISILGGTISLFVGGDGIDSNGSVNISGGNIYIEGPLNSANASLDYASTGTITGGTFVATCQSGMVQNFSTDSTQGAMFVTLTEITHEAFSLYDSTNNELITYSPQQAYHCVLISTPEITSGETYTLSTGDSSYFIEMTNLIYDASGRGGKDNMHIYEPNHSIPQNNQTLPQMPEDGIPPQMPNDGTRPKKPDNGV